jgi:hypothetical protein
MFTIDIFKQMLHFIVFMEQKDTVIHKHSRDTIGFARDAGRRRPGSLQGLWLTGSQ